MGSFSNKQRDRELQSLLAKLRKNPSHKLLKKKFLELAEKSSSKSVRINCYLELAQIYLKRHPSESLLYLQHVLKIDKKNAVAQKFMKMAQGYKKASIAPMDHQTRVKKLNSLSQSLNEQKTKQSITIQGRLTPSSISKKSTLSQSFHLHGDSNENLSLDEAESQGLSEKTTVGRMISSPDDVDQARLKSLAQIGAADHSSQRDSSLYEKDKDKDEANQHVIDQMESDVEDKDMDDLDHSPQPPPEVMPFDEPSQVAYSIKSQQNVLSHLEDRSSIILKPPDISEESVEVNESQISHEESSAHSDQEESEEGEDESHENHELEPMMTRHRESESDEDYVHDEEYEDSSGDDSKPDEFSSDLMISYLGHLIHNGQSYLALVVLASFAKMDLCIDVSIRKTMIELYHQANQCLNRHVVPLSDLDMDELCKDDSLDQWKQTLQEIALPKSDHAVAI